MRPRLIGPAALVTMVIALGFGLRLFHLDAQSFWYDEAFSAEVAEKGLIPILAGDFGDNHPPFHSVALHYWGLISRSDFMLRLFSAFAGTLGIAAIYTLGRLIFDSRVGLVGAAITALVPFQVFYSQEVRMYSTLFLATATLLISYFKAVSTSSRRWWLAYAFSAVWGMYVQFLTAFVLLGLHLDFLLRSSRRTTTWLGLALADLSVMLAFAPWLNVFLTRAQVVARGEFWLTKPGLGRLLSAPYAFLMSQFVSEKLVPLAFTAVLALCIITHLQVARELARRGKDHSGLNLLLCSSWSPLLLTFLISQWRSIYLERTLMVAVPGLYLLISWGVIRTRERYVNLVLLLLVGVFAVAALDNWYFDPDFGKPPFRSAAHFLRDNSASGEPILHTSDGAFLISLHYAPDCEHYLLSGDPRPQLPLENYQRFGGEVIAKEDLSATRFWLVVALDNSIEFQGDLVEWFDERHAIHRSYDFDGIALRHYVDASTG